MSDSLSVSKIVTCHRCPRWLYFEGAVKFVESPGYTVCKQISYYLGRPLELEKAGIWQEIETILPSAEDATQLFFEECIESCMNNTSWKLPDEVDVPVESARLGIHGRVDKIFDGDELSFAIVRSNEPPAAGVYATDRLRVACYAACVSETFGVDVDGGYVEYIPGGISRYVHPQPRDRRAMLKAIKTAKRGAAGDVPKKPMKAPCDICPHAGRCQTLPRRLSDLL